MTALISWLTTTFGPLGGALVFIVLLVLGAYIAWYAFWGIVTIVLAMTLRWDGHHLTGDLLNRLFGTQTTSEQTYTCECGAAMKQVAAVEYNEYCVETWECTDGDCLRGGQAYRFENEAHNYGTGPLTGQVTPSEAG